MWRLILIILFFFAACKKEQPPDPVDTEFGREIKVTIIGYDGDAMEPFITKDGKYLLFNSNTDDNGKDLYYAEKVDDTTFRFIGPVGGVNTEYVEANPSMDTAGNFYFISTRDLDNGCSCTVYRGKFKSGQVYDVQVVQGSVIPEQDFWFNMGVEVTASGDSMLLSYARFYPGQSFPGQGDLVLAVRADTLFNVVSSDVFVNINTDASIEYAGELSSNGLELFYSQVTLTDPPVFKLYHAKRTGLDRAFDPPYLIDVPFRDDDHAFVEAPTLSADGKRLYYHKLSDGKFCIFMLYRK